MEDFQKIAQKFMRQVCENREWLCNQRFSAKYPMTQVSWFEANTYCRAIGGRLPTEVEWEKAAGGPNGYDYGTASGSLIKQEANYFDKRVDANAMGVDTNPYRNIMPVCSYPLNGYGLCDMTGNVWEWTMNIYTYGNVSGLNIMKGGSFHHDSLNDLLSTNRGIGNPKGMFNHVGFRCVVEPLKCK